MIPFWGDPYIVQILHELGRNEFARSHKAIMAYLHAIYADSYYSSEWNQAALFFDVAFI